MQRHAASLLHVAPSEEAPSAQQLVHELVVLLLLGRELRKVDDGAPVEKLARFCAQLEGEVVSLSVFEHVLIGEWDSVVVEGGFRAVLGDQLSGKLLVRRAILNKFQPFLNVPR